MNWEDGQVSDFIGCVMHGIVPQVVKDRLAEEEQAEGEVDAACYGASWLFLPPLSIARVTRAFSSTRSLGRRCVCR